MKLKVCGMKDATNINKLIDVAPDFMGFIFHEKSPRNVGELVGVDVPDGIVTVGVFVDESETFIQQKISTHQLKAVQLHGYESPEFCQLIKNKGVIVIKAFNIHKAFDFESLVAYEPYCDYFLFDAFGKNAGGNGITFNWKLLQSYQGGTPFLLSGGIDETMVKAIKKVKHPQFVGIDVNSGFETAAGYKNIAKIKAFKSLLRD